MIGGTDVILWVGEGIPVADVILRTIRRYWPNYLLENALDNSPPFRPSAGPGAPKAPSPEFFIYRDEQAAEDWDEHGARPENTNTMIYVILGKSKQPEHRLRSVTLVIGERSGEVQQFLSELSDLFRELTFGLTPNTSNAEAQAA